jgi:hypothetical protein
MMHDDLDRAKSKLWIGSAAPGPVSRSGGFILVMRSISSGDT